ncbi:MAG: hypothetical protein R3E67_03940 [Pseudomonadales bacterium]
MLSSPLGTLSAQTFIDTIWQQQPLLVRNALPEAIGVVDGNDLAGIACEPDGEARLIIHDSAQDRWLWSKALSKLRVSKNCQKHSGRYWCNRWITGFPKLQPYSNISVFCRAGVWMTS